MKKIITIILISLSIVLVGCTSTTKSDAGSNKLEVSFDADKGCSEKSYEAKSGTLEITGKNTGKDVGELEVLDGDRISGEAENIISGASKTFTVKLEEGDYEFFCGRKQAKRSTLKIVKNADTDSTSAEASPAIMQATKDYKAYVLEQTELLKVSAKTLTDAVRAGNVEAAKTAFGPSRQPWERIEPIAELFVKYDVSIDSRVDDFNSETDPEFTGFHRIEYGIFELSTTEGLTEFADKLDADILGLIEDIKKLEVDPFDMAKGPQALMEEIANGKITGEEDRYSGTDLYDFNGNLEGSKRIVDLLRQPMVYAKSDIPEKFDVLYSKIIDRLNKYRNTDNTYQNYKSLTDEDRDQFKADVATASELLAEMPGELGLK